MQQGPPSRRYAPQGEGAFVCTIDTPDLDPVPRAASAIGACGPGHPPTRVRRGLLKIYRKGRGEGAKDAEGMVLPLRPLRYSAVSAFSPYLEIRTVTPDIDPGSRAAGADLGVRPWLL